MEKMQLLVVEPLEHPLQTPHGFSKVRNNWKLAIKSIKYYYSLFVISIFNYIADGKIVDQTHRRAQVLEFGDLLIPAVRSADAGRYTCVRANEAGKVEASAWISVLG